MIAIFVQRRPFYSQLPRSSVQGQDPIQTGCRVGGYIPLEGGCPHFGVAIFLDGRLFLIFSLFWQYLDREEETPGRKEGSIQVVSQFLAGL